MKFWKMNGAGNAFAVFDARSTPFEPTIDSIRAIASEMKADQVIAIERDATRDAFMRIWNSDGGEVSACGNATRCVADLLFEESGKDQVVIRTNADLLKARKADGGSSPWTWGPRLWVGWTFRCRRTWMSAALI